MWLLVSEWLAIPGIERVSTCCCLLQKHILYVYHVFISVSVLPECVDVMLRPLGRRWVDCAIHHEWHVREEKPKYSIHVNSRNNRVISVNDLYCCYFRVTTV